MVAGQIVIMSAVEPVPLVAQGLSTGDWAAVVSAGATAGIVFATAWGLILSMRSEGRRNQPVVIAHEEGFRRFVDAPPGMAFQAFLQNHGAGSAFNVRFGVELAGARYAFRLGEIDPGRGNRQIVGVGERVPHQGALDLSVSWEPYAVEHETLSSESVARVLDLLGANEVR